MINQFIKGNVYVFIDAANIFYTQRTLHRRVSYEAVLLSGDSDFAPVIKRMKESHKRVIVMSAKHHVSRELIQLANKYINLKKLRERIELV